MMKMKVAKRARFYNRVIDDWTGKRIAVLSGLAGLLFLVGHRQCYDHDNTDWGEDVFFHCENEAGMVWWYQYSVRMNYVGSDTVREGIICN